MSKCIRKLKFPNVDTANTYTLSYNHHEKTEVKVNISYINTLK